MPEQHPPIALLTAAVLALSTVGCQDEPFEGELIWEGEYVRLFKEAGTEIEIDNWCPGTLTHLERFTPFMMEEMAVEDRSPITFSVLESDPDIYIPGCGEHACALESAVFSRFLPLDHEIVHAVRSRAGRTPEFFEEGAAGHWGDTLGTFQVRFDTRVGMLPSVRDTLSAAWAREMTGQEYEVAAQFVGFLVDEYGREANAEFLHRIASSANRETTERGFEEVFGESLDAAVSRYEDAWPACSYEAARSPAYDCSGEPIEICDGTETQILVFDFDMSCRDPAVVGPRGGWMWRDVVFDLLLDDDHSVVAEVPTAQDEKNSYVTARGCTTHCGDAQLSEVPIQSGGNLRTDLVVSGAGRRVIRLFRSEDRPGPVTLRWNCGSP